MRQFLVTVRTTDQVRQFYAPSFTAAQAYDAAAAVEGEKAFGITVVPV